MSRSLVIIDMQNDFIDGPLGTPEAIQVKTNIIKSLNFHSFSSIYLTRDTHFSHYLETAEGKKLPIPHCIYKTDGWQINPDIMNKIRESGVPYHYLDKHSFGYNQWNSLSTFLESEEEIIIIGVCTDICVVSNALILKSIFHETPIKVISYMCAGTSVEKHNEALDVMRSCQIEVT